MGLSLLLVLAIHFGGWLAPGWFHSYFPFAEAVWQLLPAAQIVLLALWLIAGIGPFWLRLASAPALLASWAGVWADSLSSHTAATWLLLAGAIAAGVMIAARYCGLKLSIQRSASANRHPQFSIGGLILLTTLIGLGLGVLEILRPSLNASRELSAELEQVLLARVEASALAEFLASTSLRSAFLAAVLAMVALTAMFCVLRPGPMWLRLLVSAVLVPLLGFYLANLTGDDLAAGASLAASLSILTTIVGISVWPLRLAGVRLVRGTGFQPVLNKQYLDRLQTCPTEKTHEPRTAAA